MAIKYVRKTGSDSNNGNSAALAYLTIAFAITQLNAGDICYIGAGLYRENGLNPTNSGSGGSPISIVGDLDGSQTGDMGIVRITASANDNAYTNTNVWNMTRNYITLDKLWMDMSSGDCVKGTGTNNIIQNCWVRYCKGAGVNFSGLNCSAINTRVWNVLKNGEWGIKLTGGGGIVESCYLDQIAGGGACKGIELTPHASALTITARNNYVVGIYPDGGGPDCGIYFNMNSVSSAIANCYNNTVHKVKSGGANAAEGIRFAGTITGQTINFYNNEIFNVLADAGTNNTYAVVITGGSTPTINGNYNMWADCRDGVSGYTPSANDKQNNGINLLVPPLPQGTTGYDMGYYFDITSSGYDQGTSSGAPTSDIIGNPRGGAFGFDIGAFESQARITKDNSVFNTAAPATRLDGAGFIDYKFAINNTKVATITAYIKTNASYSGTQPSFGTVSSLSNTGQSGTVSYTGVSNAWQQVSIPTTSMTATADGVLTVRFQSYSTAAGSQCWIDDIVITEA